MYGYIYKRQNKLNQKIYIGQHKHIKEEVTLDKSYHGSGTIFKNALEKYGEENFTYELIDSAESPEELNEKEIYWINFYNSLTPNGYNLTKGGLGTPGFTQSDYQKEIVRDYMKNREITDEFRENCRKSKIGNFNGKGNKDLIWINDGENSFKVKSLEGIDFTIYSAERYLKESTLSKFKEAYEDRMYVKKDGKDKYIRIKDLPKYIEAGYEEGRNQDSYAARGAKISNSKKGKIKTINPTGDIKYISLEDLSKYESLGFKRSKLK